MASSKSRSSLRLQISETEQKLQKLKEELAVLEAAENEKGLEKGMSGLTVAEQHGIDIDGLPKRKWPLSKEEYKRYGRQMICPNFGIQGQLLLKKARVLVIGAGGLGCPALAYLAGAGVGTIGVVDGDEVEVSNLHRQVLHSVETVGMKKVDSVVGYMKKLNPNLNYNAYPEHLTPQNSLEIMKNYDLILDCTDNPSTRYLISDTCILLSLPLLSASALRFDGQLLLLNHPPLPAGNTLGGPCYRCVFPKPPPPASVVTCGEGGVLGPVVGVMGVLQALEAIKLITSDQLRTKKLSSKETKNGKEKKTQETSLLLFSATHTPPFRTVRLSGRRSTCSSCSSSPTISTSSLLSGKTNYTTFCGLKPPVQILDPWERVTATQYYELMQFPKPHLLVDCRDKVQFSIASLERSVNIPISWWLEHETEITNSKPGIYQTSAKPSHSPSPSSPFSANPPTSASSEVEAEKESKDKDLYSFIPPTLPPDAPIYVVCRLGNDSQIVARMLGEGEMGKGRWVGDIRGGLRAWREEVDEGFPEY